MRTVAVFKPFEALSILIFPTVFMFPIILMLSEFEHFIDFKRASKNVFFYHKMGDFIGLNEILSKRGDFG